MKSAKMLAADAGIKVVNLSATPAHPPLIFLATEKGRPFSFFHRFSWELAKLMKTLFGYRFVLECRPK